MARFRLVETYLYWWPVAVQVPDPERPGAFVRQDFEMRFQALPLLEVERLEADSRRFRLEGRIDAAETLLLERVCNAWRGVEAEDGGDAPFSRTACYAAYRDSITGERARLGN